LNQIYSEDATGVYLQTIDQGQFLMGADPKTFTILDSSDPDDSSYTKDVAHVWWFGSPLPQQVNPSAFVQLNYAYGKDANHVSFENKILQGADLATFTASSTAVWFAQDKNHLYQNGQISQ
jgi:hypothetical protein